MTPKERVLAALNLEEPDRIPYCEHAFSFEIAQKYSRPDLELKADDIESEKEICRRFRRCNVNYNFRPPVFKQKRQGTSRNFSGDGLIKSYGDLELMRFRDPYDDRLYEGAIRFLQAKEDYAACGQVKLGIMPCWESMGFETFSYALHDEPDLVGAVLEKYSSWSAAVVERLVALDFDFLWVFDDIAFKSAPFFSPEMYRTLILPKIRKVAEKITIPWIYHSDGNLLPIIDDWLSLGMNGMHPLEPGSMDINYLSENYGDRVCLVGNIDIDTLTLGTPEQVEEEVRQKIEAVGPGGGYIVSTSNSVPDYARPENVLAMTEAIYKYGEYPIRSNTQNPLYSKMAE